jgi:hypothetical protein
MRSDGTNHRSTRASCIGKILVTGFLSVQSGRSMIGSNCAYLVAFGKSLWWHSVKVPVTSPETAELVTQPTTRFDD